jgi:negative regulator of flagellin synthesis FlgM
MTIYGSKPPDSKDIYIRTQKTTRKDDVQAKKGAEKSGVADKVDISSRTKEIEELKQVINQLPDIRADKVKAIRNAIEEGTYKVDSLKIAGKILDELV